MALLALAGDRGRCQLSETTSSWYGWASWKLIFQSPEALQINCVVGDWRTQCKKNGKNVSFAMTMMSIKPFKLPRNFKKFVLEQSNYFLSSENLTFSKVCAPHEALNSKEAYKNVFTINDLNKKFRCAKLHSPSSFNRNYVSYLALKGWLLKEKCFIKTSFSSKAFTIAKAFSR